MLKRQNGVYFTRGNPFSNAAFLQWARGIDLPNREILEPFAGANNLITTLSEMGLCRHYKSFDIVPAHPAVVAKDTLEDFPEGYSVCITNPPWFAKNSATLRGLKYPDTDYDDIYKMALDECLQHCDFVAAIIPESFIRSGLFRERLSHFVSLNFKLFEETDHPAGLALFSDKAVDDVMIWDNDGFVGSLSRMESNHPPLQADGVSVRFNEPNGNLGLIALDNTREPSVRFCEVKELEHYEIKSTGRNITKLRVDGAFSIARLNDYLADYRKKTADIFMNSFRGIRKDGKYRRRCDWGLARGIIQHADCGSPL